MTVPRTVTVHPDEGVADFTNPATAVAWVATQNPSFIRQWEIVLLGSRIMYGRPQTVGYGEYLDAITLPGWTHLRWEHASATGRDNPDAPSLYLRPGTASGTFVTIGQYGSINDINIHVYVDTVPNGDLAAVKTTGPTGYITRCKITNWADANLFNTYAVIAEAPTYISDSVLAIQPYPDKRQKACCLWAKNQVSMDGGRLHDDGRAGGVGLRHSFTGTSLLSKTQLGSQDTSLFTTDLEMIDGRVRLELVPYWTTSDVSRIVIRAGV